jgi:uncharacterized protein YhhL (DUF1145 family)
MHFGILVFSQDHVLALSLYIFVMLKFWLSLIFYLCFSFSLLYLYNYVLILFIIVSLVHNVQLSLLCQGEKVTLIV